MVTPVRGLPDLCLTYSRVTLVRRVPRSQSPGDFETILRRWMLAEDFQLFTVRSFQRGLLVISLFGNHASALIPSNQPSSATSGGASTEKVVRKSGKT